MSAENPKEHQDHIADQRQGGNLETKGASQVPPSGPAEKSDAPERRPTKDDLAGEVE